MIVPKAIVSALLLAGSVLLVASDDLTRTAPTPQSASLASAVDMPSSNSGSRSAASHIIFQSLPTATPQASETDELGTEPTGSEAPATRGSESSTELNANQAREPRAECMAAGVENWDRNLQISAVFIILAVSSLGSFFPILCKHVRWLSISPTAITIGKFFGAGVILSTAFIHMLGGATESLKDSCLEGRMGDFDSWPGFLAMLAILAMHLMEHILTGRMLKTHGAGLPESIPVNTRPRVRVSKSMCQGDDEGEEVEEEEEEEAVDGEQLEKQPAHGHAHAAMLIDMDQRRKHLSTYILELGIALHSVIIGMTLAVTGGTEFKTLLAAISFHQFFEGLALGTRIAALKFPRHAVLLAAANALVFALTTPLGQVIGIGIRESFAPRSPSTLMTMGVLDGLSAGILMYSAIVNLLVEEFGSEEFRGYPRTLRLVYFGAMYLGCAAMSVIGKWA